MTALVVDEAGLRPDVKRAVVLSFTGQFHEENGVVFATCDHAALVTHGATEDEALRRMPRAIALYLSTLQQRGELDLALRSGKLHVRLAEIDPRAWASPRVSKVDGRFIAELASV